MDKDLPTTSAAGLKVNVVLGSLTTLIGKIDVPSQETTVLDKVAPVVKANTDSYKNFQVTQATSTVDAQIKVEFSEGLQLTNSGSNKYDLLVKDFKVVRDSDTTTLHVITSYSIHYTKLYEAI